MTEDVGLKEPVLDVLGVLAEGLKSAAPRAGLYEAVVRLRDSGLSRGDVQEALELLAETHRDDEDEAHYDCVLDVLDLVVGWCAVGCELYRVECEGE